MNEDTELEIAPATHNFTIIYHQTSRDKRLSWGARGLLAYMLSHSAGFRVTVKSLIKQWDYEALGMYVSGGGRSAIHKMLNELKAAGYIETQKLTKGGRYAGVKYIVHSIAKEQKEAENSTVVRNSEYGNSEYRNSVVGNSEPFKKNNLLEEQEKKEEQKERETHAQKEPAHFENFNALMGNGDIALSQDDKLAKEQLVKAIKGIVKDKTALVKIYDLADTLLEKKVTPEILTKLFGAGGWWFTSCPLNKAGTPPYVKNICNELETALATLEVKETTPAVLSPSVVMAHVNAIKDLSNGTYKEAVSRLPDNVRAIMSQALRVSKKIGFNTLAEADITAVMVKE